MHVQTQPIFLGYCTKPRPSIIVSHTHLPFCYRTMFTIQFNIKLYRGAQQQSTKNKSTEQDALTVGTLSHID